MRHKLIWRISFHNCLGYRRSGVSEVWYKMINSTYLLRDQRWFLRMSSKPSKDAVCITYNIDGNEVSCRKYIFIVTHVLPRATLCVCVCVCVNTNRMCKASNYWKMTQKGLYLSTALLFALNINNHRRITAEHNKCNDMVNCSWTYKSRHVSL